ncbi:MAG TPA: hypothetical protein VG826_28150 [Pirellulales bacterium]|nr:hypothetical protein [Pirellulales bacterium]
MGASCPHAETQRFATWLFASSRSSPVLTLSVVLREFMLVGMTKGFGKPVRRRKLLRR